VVLLVHINYFWY